MFPIIARFVKFRSLEEVNSTENGLSKEEIKTTLSSSAEICLRLQGIQISVKIVHMGPTAHECSTQLLVAA